MNGIVKKIMLQSAKLKSILVTRHHLLVPNKFLSLYFSLVLIDDVLELNTHIKIKQTFNFYFS